MDLRLKTYLKVAGIVFGMLALAFLSAWAVIAIAKANLVQENYQVIQGVAFICFIATLALFAICYFVSIVAESQVSHKVKTLKYKKRKEYEKQHKSDWTMGIVYFFVIVLMLLVGIMCFCGIMGTKDENPSNQSNQSVSTLDIEN